MTPRLRRTMITTTSLYELYQIIANESSDPHHILGMHEVTVAKKTCVAVRAFMPNAKFISVVDEKNPKKQYPLAKIQEDGFFEVILPERDQWFAYFLEIEDYAGNKWQTKDQYSFAPTVSDYDRYLFGAGNHYEIYKKLGAHLTSVQGVPGAAFAVWAPNAKGVSVVGSFNDWDGRRNQMRVLGESGIWELFIPGLAQFDQYKFQIKTEWGEQLQKADPYANFAEVRPATASVLFDIDQYEWKDQQWLEERKETRQRKKPMNIYEVHLGSFMRIPEEGNRPLTYREAADKLVSYVVSMGFSHIELMPVEEHPFDGSWGYQVTGYYAPTSRFGTPLDFKYFIDVCHQKGIGVILDWVPAHFPKDAHGLARFDGTCLYEHSDPRKGEHPDWGTLIFNYGRNEVRNFLIANAVFWAKEYHLDGLRVDAVASMLYLDYGKQDGGWIPNIHGSRENLEAVEFLKHMNSIIDKELPGVLMIAEESTAWAGVSHPAKDGGLGFHLKWNMGWMNDFLTYIEKDPIYRKFHHGELTFSMVYAYTENFILVLSHDEVVHGKGSMIEKMPGDLWQKFANLRGAYGFMYFHPGKKLMFMGSEFAQFSEWSEAKSLDWHLLEYASHKQMQTYVSDLNQFYQSTPSLWQKDFDPTGFQWIDCNDNQRSIVSFIRQGETPEDFLVILCNFTPETHMDFRVGVPKAGCYQEIFNSDQEKYGGSGIVNPERSQSEPREWNGYSDSIPLRLPPLGVSVWKWNAQN